MAYTQTISGCLESGIGAHGLSNATLANCLEGLRPAIGSLQTQYENESLPLLRVPEWTADIEEAQAALEQLCEGARTLVFFGTGGSSLGGQAVAQLGGWFIPGVEKGDQKKRPRTRFYDNLDPLTLERVLAGLDLATTRFVVISKSGGTLETVAQALAAMKAVSDAGLGDRMPELFLGVTGAGSPGNDNNLRALFSSHGMPMLEHHAGLGGRFSVLSNVGMLPALARGLDTAAFRSGARQVVQALLAANDPEGFAPAVGAATTIGLARDRNIRSVIMMPYSDRLGRFADWFVQLWAESLGKGGAGTTPLAALGPVDQHSQLQLFLDGPRDHLVTVIRQDASGTGPLLDAELATSAGVQMIAGRTVGDLVNAQQQAIPQALIEAGRPVRTIDIESLDESVLGGLMMHFMLETILAAHLLGVDPYDQPAVEAGKVLTRRYLET